MKSFPSIDQFRQTIREVKSNHDYKGKSEDDSPIYLHDSPYPEIFFEGTVKIHGTNAAVVKYQDRIEYQSRERVLSLTQDNAGFMLAMMNKDLNEIFDNYSFDEYIAVYGEWCGQGIQKGVAVSQLPKMFVVFAVKVDGEWQDFKGIDFEEKLNKIGVYSIHQFERYYISVDFNNPELSQNRLIEITERVEAECPVGRYFGVSGVGEGVVWSANHNDRHYIFKVKGEKHSVSKVKTLASVDVEQIENIKQFVESVVTENRLEQGFEYLERNSSLPPDQSQTGDFLRWVVNDVMKEESDTIVSNQLEVKKVNSAISNKARVWYFNRLNSLAF